MKYLIKQCADESTAQSKSEVCSVRLISIDRFILVYLSHSF